LCLKHLYQTLQDDANEGGYIQNAFKPFMSLVQTMGRRLDMITGLHSPSCFALTVVSRSRASISAYLAATLSTRSFDLIRPMSPICLNLPLISNNPSRVFARLKSSSIYSVTCQRESPSLIQMQRSLYHYKKCHNIYQHAIQHTSCSEAPFQGKGVLAPELVPLVLPLPAR